MIVQIEHMSRNFEAGNIKIYFEQKRLQMLCLIVAVLGSVVFADQEVYEINGTKFEAAGFYVQIDYFSTLRLKTFRQLGSPTDSGLFIYLYNLRKKPGVWNIGVRNKEGQLQRLYSASGRKDGPPVKGWKSRKGADQVFEVWKKSNLVSTLTWTEANEGSATVDGGLICLKQDSKKWIMKKGGSRKCYDDQDCKNGMDVIERENCPPRIESTSTTTTTTTKKVQQEHDNKINNKEDSTLSTNGNIMTTNDASDSKATESNPSKVVTEDGNRFLPDNPIDSDSGSLKVLPTKHI